METLVEFRVLGPLEVAVDGEPLALGGRQQRAVLALMLMNANEVVSHERMVDALWGQAPPATARNALQVAIHGLRKALGRGRVLTQGAGYRLEVRSGELDLDRFEELVAGARNQPAALASPRLHAALALRRGVALADLAGAPFLAGERERLEELQRTALEARIEADLELGRAPDLVSELERLVSEHPFRERLRMQLMLALYRSGRQADALQSYRDARATLVDQLGVEPSRELQELEARILRQDPALDVMRAVERPPTTIPSPARPLVGRELELAAVTSLLRTESRLVTLTGPGGTGKTRLALEVGLQLLDDFPGGAFLVDLAPVRDHELVAPTVARALGVTDADETALIDRIASAIGENETLVVVDNFEHVLASAPFVAEALSRVPGLKVLATSREPLRVAPEQEYRVPPLDLPPRGATLEATSRSDAVTLFVARARAVEPSFGLTEANVGVVAAICRALDGLPLALELAAARVRLLSPSALLDRLENRLAVLDEGGRDLPDRQRTLRATIDWSYELLDPRERGLLARLSVFAGGWTLDAAEAVCGATLSTLGSLVEKSLVSSTREDAGEPRFSMLETVREYALERLAGSGEAKGVRNAHAEYFATLAEHVEPDLYSSAVFDRVELEHDNFRVALASAGAAGDTDLLLRLCAIARFWYVRGYQIEGRGWLEAALARGDGDPRRRALVLGWAGGLAWTQGDDEVAIARAAESLALSRVEGEELGMLRALTALGLAHSSAGNVEEAREWHTQSLELARKLDRDRDVVVALGNLAGIAFDLGEHEVVRQLLEESLVLSREVSADGQGVGVALLTIGASALEQGDEEEARRLVLESLGVFRDLDFKDYTASALVAYARGALETDPHLAARALGASAAIRAPLGPAAYRWEPEWHDRAIDALHVELGEEVTADEVARGRATPEQILDELLATDLAS